MTQQPTPPHAHSSGPLWHPTDYPRILYKRRWVAIPGFLLLFLSGTLSSIQTVPVYEATTQLLVERDARRATSISGVLEDRTGYYEDDFYPTQYRIMQSRLLAARTVQALDDAGVKEHVPAHTGVSWSLTGLLGAAKSGVVSVLAWTSGRTGDTGPSAEGGTADAEAELAARADGFLAGVRVEPIRLSRLVELKYRSPDRNYAARAVNELARQYNLQSLEFRFAASKETSDWLGEQLEEQRVKVAESEAALQQYKERHGTVAVDDRQNIVVQRLTELNAQVTQARIERIDREAMYNRLADLRRSGMPIDAFPAVITNEVVQQLKTDINRLRAQKAELAARGLGENFPDMRDLTSRIEAAETRLGVELDRVVESVRNEFLAAQAKETSMVSALNAQRGESLGLDRRAIEYAALEREAVANRQLYENLMQRTKETGVSGEYRGSNVQVVDRAEVPLAPVLPRLERDMTVAALSGLLLAVFLAFGVEYFDSRIKSPEEIKAHLGLPFLGLVPVATSTERQGKSPLLDSTTPSAFGEAIRAVRTAVLFSSADDGARSVAVTSTGPSEGKTMIASSLAVALAQAGQRTLIIDADMRRPRVHEALGESQEPGLANVVVGATALDKALRQSQIKNLWLLPAGHIPPNPAELLGSKKFAALIHECKTRFDWIVVDAPPVLPVTDAAVLAHSIGGVLFVVGAEMTSRHTAATAVDQLRAAGAHFLGVVLNRVNVRGNAYYYSAHYRKDYAKYYQRSASQA